MACFSTIAPTRLTAAAVNACQNTFDGDAHEQACLVSLAASRRDPVQLVEMCKGRADGDEQELACLDRFGRTSSWNPRRQARFADSWLRASR